VIQVLGFISFWVEPDRKKKLTSSFAVQNQCLQTTVGSLKQKICQRWEVENYNEFGCEQ